MAQTAFALGSGGGRRPVALKALFAAADVAIVWLLLRLGAGFGAALYAFHPLPVLEIAGQGHVDSLGVALLLASLLLLAARRPVLSGLAFALSVLTKYVSLGAVLPVVRRGGTRWAVAAALAAAAIWAAWSRGGVSPAGSLGAYATRWEFNSVLYPGAAALVRAADLPARAKAEFLEWKARHGHPAWTARVFPYFYDGFFARALLGLALARRPRGDRVARAGHRERRLRLARRAPPLRADAASLVRALGPAVRRVETRAGLPLAVSGRSARVRDPVSDAGRRAAGAARRRVRALRGAPRGDALPEGAGMRYRAVLAYVGTRFHGWQRQTNAPRTVQAVLEKALSSFDGSPVSAHAAGRTDAGVHADGQVVHFDLTRERAPERVRDAVNALLPEDARLLAVDFAAPEFHARRDAAWKEYLYRWSRAPVIAPRDAPFVAPISPRAEVARMRGRRRICPESAISPSSACACRGRADGARAALRPDRGGRDRRSARSCEATLSCAGWCARSAACSRTSGAARRPSSASRICSGRETAEASPPRRRRAA